VVAVRASGRHPILFKKMVIGVKEGRPEDGDLVQVVDRDGVLLGSGIWSGRSEVALRLLSRGAQLPDEGFWRERIGQAVALRREGLRLDEVSTAYRVVHAEGDGLSGLVIDRYGEILSGEVFGLGLYQRAGAIMQIACEHLGTTAWRVEFDARAAAAEGVQAEVLTSSGAPRAVEIREHGVRYRVEFEGGHKTGFFCDQRENRRKLARLATGRTLLDLCSYTGGFSVAALALGKAREATAVDLDTAALELARQNANLNQVRLSTTQADAFAYARQMGQNARHYGAVVLDPPKLVASRSEMEAGMRKYLDLNRLAIGLVEEGGYLLTCSCSGLVSAADFVDIVRRAARGAGRVARVLEVTGHGADHPVLLEAPEGAYLKAVWLRVDDVLEDREEPAREVGLILPDIEDDSGVARERRGAAVGRGKNQVK
jgi:23S rRNA (cytosine1962-C5)-methyltransferase